MGRLASFLYRNHCGIYCFQRRIPKRLLLANPKLSTICRKSLRTRDHAEAVKLARKLSVMFDELAQTYFETEENYKHGLEILRQFRIAETTSPRFQ